MKSLPVHAESTCIYYMVSILLSEMVRPNVPKASIEIQNYYIIMSSVRVIVRGTPKEELATMCVCVFFPFILDIKFVGRTSRGHTGGRSHRISHPPSFCGACLNFSREKDPAIPFPRRP